MPLPPPSTINLIRNATIRYKKTNTSATHPTPFYQKYGVFINLKLSEYKWQKIFNTSKMNIITMSEIQILQKKGNQLKDFKLP